MLERFTGKSSRQGNADALYGEAVAQARRTEFYTHMGVPDTVDGRFDMIALHVYLVLRRLKQGDDRCQLLAQALFDTMFTDMDRGLREMGAGDLGVGRRVKVMAKAFYGRVAAYDHGLTETNGGLIDAILRNIFRGVEQNRENASMIASYMRHQATVLEDQPIEVILDGQLTFSTPATERKGNPAL